jgi:hypothetical protein
MTPDEIRAHAATVVGRSTRVQGVPLHVENPNALALCVHAIRGARHTERPAA